MPRLTDYLSYADAQTHFSREALWSLLDGSADAMNLAHECIDRHVGTGLTVTVIDKDGNDAVHSVDDIARWSNRFANFLQARGIRKGDRVAIMLQPSLQFYFALFGAMKAGAIGVPLYTLFGRDGLALRVEDCSPKLLVTSPEKMAIAEGFAGVEVVEANDAFTEALGAYDDHFAPATTADDMAMFQYTSGTTRELPEAVKHRHRAVVTVLVAALYGTGIRPGDRYLCPSSPAWGHGLWHGTIAPLALGVSIWAWAGPFDGARLLSALETYKITNLSAATTHYRLMKNSGEAANHKYFIEKLTYTGEPTDTATEEFIVDTFGHRACSMYGTTEVGVILVNYPGARDIEVKPKSLGKPVPGLQIEIHDANGHVCPPDQIGEIVVKRGGEWVRTKDLGWADGEGYFYHGGRADDVIISAGWTMSAKEIEDTLLKHPDVLEAAVIGVPDATRGQVVKAYIVARREGDAVAEELQTFTRTRLSAHEFPRIVEFVHDLPKTPSGKVNRKALRDRMAAQAAAS